MDYFRIGQKIREFRKKNAISQEQLAEKVGISVTHMSHIETGNTKLSLPVLVEIARVLEIKTDDLLRDRQFLDERSYDEILDILDRCDDKQLQVLTSILSASKEAMDRYLDSNPKTR